jgi:hypothetical protein
VVTRAAAASRNGSGRVQSAAARRVRHGVGDGLYTDSVGQALWRAWLCGRSRRGVRRARVPAAVGVDASGTSRLWAFCVTAVSPRLPWGVGALEHGRRVGACAGGRAEDDVRGESAVRTTERGVRVQLSTSSLSGGWSRRSSGDLGVDGPMTGRRGVGDIPACVGGRRGRRSRAGLWTRSCCALSAPLRGGWRSVEVLMPALGTCWEIVFRAVCPARMACVKVSAR